MLTDLEVGLRHRKVKDDSKVSVRGKVGGGTAVRWPRWGGLGEGWGTLRAQIWTGGFLMPLMPTRYPLEKSCKQLDRPVVFWEVWAEADICPQMPAAQW